MRYEGETRVVECARRHNRIRSIRCTPTPSLRPRGGAVAGAEAGTGLEHTSDAAGEAVIASGAVDTAEVEAGVAATMIPRRRPRPVTPRRSRRHPDHNPTDQLVDATWGSAPTTRGTLGRLLRATISATTRTTVTTSIPATPDPRDRILVPRRGKKKETTSTSTPGWSSTPTAKEAGTGKDDGLSARARVRARARDLGIGIVIVDVKGTSATRATPLEGTTVVITLVVTLTPMARAVGAALMGPTDRVRPPSPTC